MLPAIRAAPGRLATQEVNHMTFGELQVRPGMLVVDTTGAEIGRISETSVDEFVVQRPDGDITLAYDTVRALLGDRVVLDTGPDLDRGV
jgi:hypothetical protein